MLNMKAIIPYHVKVMVNVEGFCGQANGQTERQARQKPYPLDLLMLVHKNGINLTSISTSMAASNQNEECFPATCSG